MNFGLSELIFIGVLILFVYVVGGSKGVRSLGRLTRKGIEGYAEYQIDKVRAIDKFTRSITDAVAEELEENLRRWSNRSASNDQGDFPTSRPETTISAQEILGVSAEATCEEIKSAYRRCAKEVHPDHNQNRIEWATAEMQKVNAAAEYLLRYTC